MLRLISNGHPNSTPHSSEETRVVQTLLTHFERTVSPCQPNLLVDSTDIMIRALPRIRSLLSAFKRLPEPVLGQIFDHFVRDRPTMDCRTRAHTLCSVSRRWRTVAIATPLLWTSLELNLRPGWKPTFDSICISRSCALPIDIRIYYQEYFPAALDDALHLILRHLPRIRYLLLDLLEPWSGAVPARPAHVFSPLRDVAVASHLAILDISLPPRTIAWEWISSIVQNAPNLHAFSFIGDPIPNTPWSQLQSLSLGPVTLRESLRVLSQTPRLRSCDFILTPCQPPQRNIITHPLRCLMLQRLATGPYRTDDITDFLAHVTLPSLISLAIAGAHRVAPHVLAFLSRSDCAPRRLNLLDTRLTTFQIGQIVLHPHMQKLQFLNIELFQSIITRDLLGHLRVVGGQPPLIESLRRIYLWPVVSSGAAATLVATLSEKAVYTVRLVDGMLSMSADFTYVMPESDCEEWNRAAT
ncbi:hypothetical protein DFH07DRAFT_940225 [Mycena maculata]|uniref:F-box domain-containing protein n=1 Tax=Mycena maculata TaxID=230809 RepID=A0AAD7J7Q0_9AGAR|nr:hypothetical protein DFH07DRAFT_940225 [Mycena maculata]